MGKPRHREVQGLGHREKPNRLGTAALSMRNQGQRTKNVN